MEETYGKNKTWEHDGTRTIFKWENIYLYGKKHENTWGKEETFFQAGKGECNLHTTGWFCQVLKNIV